MSEYGDLEAEISRVQAERDIWKKEAKNESENNTRLRNKMVELKIEIDALRAALNLVLTEVKTTSPDAGYIIRIIGSVKEKSK